MSTLTLNQMLRKFIDEYSSELADARATSNYSRPFGKIVRQDIPEFLREHIDSNIYKVEGSVGKGNWTFVPWIAVFDKRITTSATTGVYIVYLLNKDSKTLYLTLNQGATSISQDVDAEGVNATFVGITTDTNAKVKPKSKIDILTKRANSIRAFLTIPSCASVEPIDSGSKEYDAGCIFQKSYTLDSLPDDSTLLSDLNEFIESYQEYYHHEYNDSAVISYSHRKGIFDTWEIINETTAVKTCDKSFFDNYSSDIPNEICWFFDADNMAPGEFKQIELSYEGTSYSAQITNESSDPNAVKISWSNDLGSKLVSFAEKEIAKAAFIMLSKGIYQLEITCVEDNNFSVKNSINDIKQYIAAKGFSYTDGLIENYYLCLKSKPFVILAGTSGTGKTRLVKLFADAIGAGYKMISVSPDWSDRTDLFGHYDLNGNFIEGPICECFKLAQNNPNKPVFLCLDEMNLARVEYYFSDFLSVIESREKTSDGGLVTTPIAQYHNGIPDNLYFVGTVNMDETTFPFSKKVLDRANTIEFSYVDLTPSFVSVDCEPKSLSLPNSFLRTKYLILNKDCIDEQEYVSGICLELKSINDILAKANLHVGYRVRDEIVFYMLNNKLADNLLTHNQALDNEIMQKILPRIQGSSASIRNILCELFKFCCSDHNQKTGDTDSEKMDKVLNDQTITCKYRKSAEKIELMVRRFEEDGFTSYWL